MLRGNLLLVINYNCKDVVCCILQDCQYQLLSRTPISQQFDFIYNEIETSYSNFIVYLAKNPRPEVNQRILEAVGGLRFALKFAADCISQKIGPDGSATVSTWTETEVDKFLSLAKDCCIHHLFHCKPQVFLFKLLFRQHGVDMAKFFETEGACYDWVVPDLKNFQASKI